MNISFSVTMTESNLKIVEAIWALVAQLDNTPVYVVPSNTGEVVKAQAAEVAEAPKMVEPKHRKVRVLTEADKEKVRVRFAYGRVKAAKARGEDPRPQDLETIAKAEGKTVKVKKALVPGTPEGDKAIAEAKAKIAAKHELAKSAKSKK